MEYVFTFYKHIVRVNCEVGTVLDARETKMNKIWSSQTREEAGK